MARRVVTLPDGRKIRVIAPDDADDEEVFAFALHTLIIEGAKSDERHEKAIAELLDRIKHIEAAVNQKGREAPVLRVNPEVKVITDPAVAAAIRGAQESADTNAQLMREAVQSIDQGKAKPAKWTFDVVHETDTHSPRFGRMKRVIASSGG